MLASHVALAIAKERTLDDAVSQQSKRHKLAIIVKTPRGNHLIITF